MNGGFDEFADVIPPSQLSDLVGRRSHPARSSRIAIEHLGELVGRGRMARRARRLRAEEFRRLEQSYLLQAEHSPGGLERDSLLNIARGFGYAAAQIEKRAVIGKTVVLCAIAALALLVLLYIP